MLFLVLHIVLISGFGLILKNAENRGHRLTPIGFVNYLIAFLISVWSAAQAGNFEFTKLTFAFGLTNGIAYSTGLGLVILGMRLSGIIVTIAVVRLSLVVPIVFAVLFWNEIPNVWQAVGITLACCALPLLGTKNPAPGRTSPPTPLPDESGLRSPHEASGLRSLQGEGNSRPSHSLPSLRRGGAGGGVGKGAGGLGLFVVALLFINSGISRLAMKAFNEMCPIDQKPMYLLFLFGATTIAYAGACFYHKTAPTRSETLYGVLLGICNMGGSWAFLNALDRVDALIAFPVSGSGGVLFTMMVAILLLGERLNRKSMIGVAATILALVFVNLKE